MSVDKNPDGGLELRYPSIDHMSCGVSSESEDEVEGSEDTSNVLMRLHNLVRKQYYGYLEKMLKENYEKWCSQNLDSKEISSTKWIQKCALAYEEKAVKSCMVVNFYRKSMLKIIANIRRDTASGRLAQKFEIIKENEKKSSSERSSIAFSKPALREASTQTDKIPEAIYYRSLGEEENKQSDEVSQMRHGPSLDERIEIFQKVLEKQEKRNELFSKHKEHLKKRKRSISDDSKVNYKKHISCTKPNPCVLPVPQIAYSSVMEIKHKKEDDEIAKELDILFAEEKDELDEVFGSDNCDPQVDKILKEIKEAKLPGYKHSNEKPESNTNLISETVENESSKRTESLTDSLWPCELHMRQQRLREVLVQIADRGLRHHDRIKKLFIEMFGEDSEDEFAPYSPSEEMNEILLSSCRKRIAPWIVKHLMKPMREGLIGNRFLFKKLAKRLATSIIIDNQYPDEKYIKSTVDDFFCFRRRVLCLEDIEAS